VSSSYRELIAWQKSKKLAMAVYRATAGFPKHEIYALASQLRRAAVSVPSNIAEGQGRLTRGEFVQFLGNARGSLFEVQTQLEIAHDLGYLTREQMSELEQLSYDVGGLLNRLIQSLQKSKAAGA